MTVLERLPAAYGRDTATDGLELQQLDRVLATLPDDQRILLVLVLVEGYSYQEAAAMTETPIGTVMSRLSRGRKAFAQALQEANHAD